MKKIGSSLELQAELTRIMNLAQRPYPSRVMLASELQNLADRLVVAKMSPDDWKQKGDQWMASAKYAGGAKHDWAIKKVGEKYRLGVKIDDSGLVYERKKDFDSLEQAQKFAWKFIDKANGHEMLEPVLDKEFAAKKG